MLKPQTTYELMNMNEVVMEINAEQEYNNNIDYIVTCTVVSVHFYLIIFTKVLLSKFSCTFFKWYYSLFGQFQHVHTPQK